MLKPAGSAGVVAVIGTGGSIAHLSRDSLDLHEYGEAGRIVDVGELLAHVPELQTLGSVFGVDLGQLGSTHIGPSDWLRMVAAVHATLHEHPELSGIVVTHGTASLEETAYFLNLAVKVEIPVVIAGAQRPLTGLSSDGPINLLNAVRAAASPACRGLGVVSVFNNEIQAARDVTKTSTGRLETFQSREVGMLGYVDADGSVAVYRRPTRRHAPDTEFDVRGLDALPRVEIVYSFAGADGGAIESAVERGVRAIVSAGFAPGVVTPAEWHALKEARRKGIVVVQSSRAGSGRVLSRTQLRKHGIVVADNLNPQKARVLTMLGLTLTEDPTLLQALFNEY